MYNSRTHALHIKHVSITRLRLSPAFCALAYLSHANRSIGGIFLLQYLFMSMCGIFIFLRLAWLSKSGPTQFHEFSWISSLFTLFSLFTVSVDFCVFLYLLQPVCCCSCCCCCYVRRMISNAIWFRTVIIATLSRTIALAFFLVEFSLFSYRLLYSDCVIHADLLSLDLYCYFLCVSCFYQNLIKQNTQNIQKKKKRNKISSVTNDKSDVCIASKQFYLFPIRHWAHWNNK